jgi:hypothetical protein
MLLVHAWGHLLPIVTRASGLLCGDRVRIDGDGWRGHVPPCADDSRARGRRLLHGSMIAVRS